MVIHWLEKLFDYIESGEKLKTISNREFHNEFQGKDLRIRCYVSKNNGFVAIGLEYGFSIDNQYKTQKIMPFINKVVRIVGYAVSQLLEYKQEYNIPKYVLLNWQKPRYFVLLTKEEEFYDFVKSLDKQVKSINNSLYVKLLDKDSLP